MKSAVIDSNQVILHANGRICGSQVDLLSSEVTRRVLRAYLSWLSQRDSPLLDLFHGVVARRPDGRVLAGEREIARLLGDLLAHPLGEAAGRQAAMAGRFDGRKEELLEFVEGLYNFWRSYDRFLVCHSETTEPALDSRPYRTFNLTVERLTHLVRSAYRDICENISGDHPRVYRQVPAGCQVGIIAVPKEWPCPRDAHYRLLPAVPFIRQVWIDPPFIIDPPCNKRTGQFSRVERNPLAEMRIRPQEWLCYPARVGDVTVFVYFNVGFMGLGCALANLFELASDDDIASGPGAVYFYGADPEACERAAAGPGPAARRDQPTPAVFHDDRERGLLVAAVPLHSHFGYFGYLKKMILTLHNVVAMKRGRMPFHGAMARIRLRGGREATVVIVGDTATGKSETLEALRMLAGQEVRDLKVVADDMGCFAVDRSAGSAGTPVVRGYGTETGAFVRLDDLDRGFAFGQIDRAILMSPQKVNARTVLPVTTLAEVNKGHPVDFILYANNYEPVDDRRPVLQRFGGLEEALAVFRTGAAMAKGTTSSTGMGETYFANPFGPVQYMDLHENLAREHFAAAFAAGVVVGQLRTMLGVPGHETEGPAQAARALLAAIEQVKGCSTSCAAGERHA